MVLSDVDIRRYLAEGKRKISPELFGSCSVDFRLDDEFSVFEHSSHALIDLRGWATLERSNLGVLPVALYPGIRIRSFTFEHLSSRVEVPSYKKAGNKYAGQDRPVASRLASETSR